VSGDDLLLVTLRALRDRVTGVVGLAVASADGLLVAADADGVEPDGLAALAAAELSLGQRMAHVVGVGAFREVAIRASDGYIVVYAVGGQALLVVLGDSGLNVARLHLEARAAVDRIASLLPSPRTLAEYHRSG
jgi:predicted regulator of Ras-like GTPase activity (Roadblock/LC7/MglB family)